jgi:hypothetical protein
MPDGSRKLKEHKDSQLILRINGKDRDDFVTLCKALDTSAAREIRAFIRGFVAAHTAQEPQVSEVEGIIRDSPDLQPEKRKSKRGKKRK